MPVSFQTVLLEENIMLANSYENDENIYDAAVAHRFADGVCTGYDLQP